MTLSTSRSKAYKLVDLKINYILSIKIIKAQC